MLPPEAFTRFIVMMSFALVFWMTGLLFILAFLDHKAMEDVSVPIGMGISTGIIIAILVVLGLSILNIPTTKGNLSITFVGLLTISLYRTQKRFGQAPLQLAHVMRRAMRREVFPLIIFFTVLAVRTAQIRNVFVPNWIDGLTHATLLDRYIAREGIPLDTIYHVGFHALGLTIRDFWGLSIPETILLLGQWLGAVSGLSIYYLARQYTHDIYSTSLSFIAYSLFLIFPSDLTSWGRYPFLLGLTLLPFAIITSLEWIKGRDGSYMAAALFLAGLALSHYACLLIWFSFICAQWISGFTFKRKREITGRGDYIRGLSRPALLILPLLLLLLPKAMNLSNHPAILNNMIESSAEPSFGIEAQYLLQELHSKNYSFLYIWFLSVPWFIARKPKLLYVTVYWPILVWALTYAQFRTLGFAVSTYINLVIFLAMPAALAFGFLVHESILLMRHANTFLFHAGKTLQNALLSVPVILCLIWGVMSAPHSIDPERILFTHDDSLAMEWIKENTSTNAGFLIGATSWTNNQLIPSDGGGWIRYFTGRRILIPAIGELYDLCEYSRLNGVTYMYFGKPLVGNEFDLRLDEFPASLYKPVYRNQSVAIFQLSCLGD